MAPARFQLIAAMNPCPCGFLGDVGGRCRCTPDQVARYRGKLSGPLLDRIDLQVFVPRIEPAALIAAAEGSVETSAVVRVRVAVARAIQQRRAGKPNALLTPSELERDAPLDAASRQLLETAMNRLGLSARAFHRIIKVARSIADLANAQAVAPPHLAEAIRLRQMDRTTSD